MNDYVQFYFGKMLFVKIKKTHFQKENVFTVGE